MEDGNPVTLGTQLAVPCVLLSGEVALVCMVDFGSAKSNRLMVEFYVFIWCFQDERVHTVLPDCLGDTMLSLRPENLQPLTKDTLLVLETVLRSQAQLPSRRRCQDPFKYSRRALASPRRFARSGAAGKACSRTSS